MFGLLLLLNLASIIAFVTGLINPKLVLRGDNRTRRKSSEIYLSVFVLSFIGTGIFAPKPEPGVVIAPATKSKAKVVVAPIQEVKPSPTPEATPTPTQPVEIEPPKVESNTTTHSDGSYAKETVETRTFQNPDKSIYLLIKKTEKNVERGKITTIIRTQIQNENSDPRTTEVVATTQTDQGTQIETEKIAENGVIDKQQTSNDNIPQEVWDSFKIAEQAPQESQSEDVDQSATTIPTGSKCEDFATQEQAQVALPNNPQLDRDGDGTACDSLVSGSSSSHSTGSRRRKR
ncbi:excalibur calcium-binding domain-containing protein [Nostoc sp. CHAB 5824]|nr:excalibur calcium-binding domain-containing protein [Nostoc sp. CHAB 5824]